jgi:hypothetical protein
LKPAVSGRGSQKPFFQQFDYFAFIFKSFFNRCAAPSPHILIFVGRRVNFARCREDFNSLVKYFESPVVSLLENQGLQIRNSRIAISQWAKVAVFSRVLTTSIQSSIPLDVK